MSSEDLVNRLSSGVAPVRRPLRTPALSGVWALLSLAAVLGLVWNLPGPRGDLGAIAQRLSFLLTLASLAAVLLQASYLCLRSAVPGNAVPTGARVLLAFSVFMIFASYALGWVEHEDGAQLLAGLSPAGLECSLTLLLLSLLPGAALFWAVRRFAPVAFFTTGWLLGLAMAAAGGLGLSLCCSISDPVHLLVYHGLPVLLLGTGLAAAGRKLLSW